MRLAKTGQTPASPRLRISADHAGDRQADPMMLHIDPMILHMDEQAADAGHRSQSTSSETQQLQWTSAFPHALHLRVQ